MKAIHFFIALLLIQLFCSPAAKAQNKENSVKLVFTNIHSSKGTLRVGVFKTQEEFAAEKPFKSFNISKSELANNSLSAIINLPNGSYGISILDDENNNAKMDYNMVGIPKEGFGFSNYYLSGFSKPKLKDFTFTVENGSVQVSCKMRYI